MSVRKKKYIYTYIYIYIYTPRAFAKIPRLNRLEKLKNSFNRQNIEYRIINLPSTLIFFWEKLQGKKLR